MFRTRTEEFDYNFVDLDKLNTDYCKFFNLCRLCSVSGKFRFRGCSISIWYLFIRKPQWRANWKSLISGMGSLFKEVHSGTTQFIFQ